METQSEKKNSLSLEIIYFVNQKGKFVIEKLTESGELCWPSKLCKCPCLQGMYSTEKTRDKTR